MVLFAAGTILFAALGCRAKDAKDESSSGGAAGSANAGGNAGNGGATGTPTVTKTLCDVAPVATMSLNPLDNGGAKLWIGFSSCLTDVVLTAAVLDGEALVAKDQGICGCATSSACYEPDATHCEDVPGRSLTVWFEPTEVPSTDWRQFEATIEIDGEVQHLALGVDTALSAKCSGRIETYDCVVCTPDCSSRVCGSDGCEGSCGTCGSEEVCRNGACEASDITNAACDDCLATCEGLSNCCTGTACLCEEECTEACEAPNSICCSSLGDCMCLPAGACPY